jgi:hypothetical protein
MMLVKSTDLDGTFPMWLAGMYVTPSRGSRATSLAQDMSSPCCTG